MNSSLEWLEALDAGFKRKEARTALLLAQSVSAMFGDSAEAVQEKLVDES